MKALETQSTLIKPECEVFALQRDNKAETQSSVW